MYYAPRYRDPHEILKQIGFLPASGNSRGYELRKKDIDADLRTNADFDRIHAVVTHGYINLHEDRNKLSPQGKVTHEAVSSHAASHYFYLIKSADKPRNVFEKLYKDFITFSPIDNVKSWLS